MREQWVTTQRFNYRGHPVVPPDAQIVPLCHVMGEYDP